LGKRQDNDEAIARLIEGFVSQGRRTTALGEAARWGRIDLIEGLLQGGVGVDDRTEFGATSLMLAASGGQTRVVAYLIERGADVNAVSERKRMTPLIACVAALHTKRVYLKILELLLGAGAGCSLSVRDAEGRTALDWARDGRPEEVVTLLEEHWPD